MRLAEKGTAAKDAERYPVEQLKSKMKMPDSIHAGTCMQMGWSRGKELTEKEYTAAVENFKKTAAGRRKHA